jgi:hypothetical protein
MQAQQSTYSKPDIADFSAALTRASTAKNKSAGKNKNEPPMSPTFEEYDPYNNRNLSSVLSKITDEGPANLTKSNGRKQGRNTRRSDSVDTGKIQDDKYTPAMPENTNHQHLLPQSYTFEDADIGNDAEQVSAKTSSISQQLVLVLLLATICAMGFLLYKLTLQTNELSDALRLNEEQILRSGDTQNLPSELLPRLTSLGQSLKELKVELQGIKAGQQETNNRLDLNTPSELEPRLMQIASTNEEVGELKNEFDRIQREMHEMETEINAIKTETPTRQSVIADQKIVSEQGADQAPNRSDQLVVTLASLTTRDKALAAYEKLQRSGVSPLIEEVIVNENKVFRINVEGFSSRASASAFISEANEKYGFDGGWIRKN